MTDIDLVVVGYMKNLSQRLVCSIHSGGQPIKREISLEKEIPGFREVDPSEIDFIGNNKFSDSCRYIVREHQHNKDEK